MGEHIPRIKIRSLDIDDDFYARTMEIKIENRGSIITPHRIPSQKVYQFKAYTPTTEKIGELICVVDYPIKGKEISEIFQNCFWKRMQKYISIHLEKMIHVPVKAIYPHFPDSFFVGTPKRGFHAKLSNKEIIKFYEMLLDMLYEIKEEQSVLAPNVLIIQLFHWSRLEQSEIFNKIKKKVNSLFRESLILAPIIDPKVYGDKISAFEIDLKELYEENVTTEYFPILAIKPRKVSSYRVTYRKLWDFIRDKEACIWYPEIQRNERGEYISYPHFKYFRFGDLFSIQVRRTGGPKINSFKGFHRKTIEIKPLEELTTDGYKEEFLEDLKSVFPFKDFKKFVEPALQNWEEAMIDLKELSDETKKREISEKRQIINAILNFHEHKSSNKEFNVVSTYVKEGETKTYLEEKTNLKEKLEKIRL